MKKFKVSFELVDKGALKLFYTSEELKNKFLTGPLTIQDINFKKVVGLRIKNFEVKEV